MSKSKSKKHIYDAAFKIQKCIKLWLNRLNKLLPVEVNNCLINYNYINYFDVSEKHNNDKFNKKRESIISAIINNKLDGKYFEYSSRWNKLKTELNRFLRKLCKKKTGKYYNTICCKIKAGRRNSYDFVIKFDDIKINLEFKFNAVSITETPQFVSPMKPSKYLNMNFEEWFYDNYIQEIVSYSKLEKPSKVDYLNQIHSNTVLCMTPFKKLYSSNKDFNNHCKCIDKKAIKKFIQLTHIDTNKLSDYLLKNQKKKEYLCYKNGKFYHDSINEDLYKISSLVKKENTNYIYRTVSGLLLEIKLRFKNGCGLQFPAFQIKRKVPTVKQLRQICEDNDIKSPRLKGDICKLLDKNNIIY